MSASLCTEPGVKLLATPDYAENIPCALMDSVNSLDADQLRSLRALLALWEQMRRKNALVDPSDVAQVYWQQPFLHFLNEKGSYMHLTLLYNTVVSPFMSIGGPMILWMVLVSLYRWVMGLCADSAWIHSQLCGMLVGVPTFADIAGTWGYVAAALSFIFYVAQNMWSLSAAWSTYQGYQTVSALLTRLETQDRLETLLLRTLLYVPQTNLTGCEGTVGWGHRAAAVWKAQNDPAAMQLRSNRGTFVGQVDILVARALVRLQSKKAAASG